MKKNISRILESLICIIMLVGLVGCGTKSNSDSHSTSLDVNNCKVEISELSYEDVIKNQDALYYVGMSFTTDNEGNTIDIWMIPNDENYVIAVGKNDVHVGGFFAEDYLGYSLEDAFVISYNNLVSNGDILEKQKNIVCRITAMSFDREDELKDILKNAVERIDPTLKAEYFVDSEVRLISECFNLDEMYLYRQENPNGSSNNSQDNGNTEDFKVMTLSEDTSLDAVNIDLSSPLIIDLNGNSLKLSGLLQFDSNQCKKYEGVLEEELGDGRYCGIFRVKDSSSDMSGMLDVSDLHFGMSNQDEIDKEDADIDFHTCVALFNINYKNVIGIDKGSEHNETDPYFDLHVDGSGDFMNLIYFYEGYETRTQYWNEYIYEALNNNINVEDYNESLCMHDAEIELNFDNLNLDCESETFGGPKDYFIYIGKNTTLKLTGTYDYKNVSLKIIYLDRFGDGPVTIDAADLKFILHDEYRQTEIIKVDQWLSDAVQENVNFIYPTVATEGSSSNLMAEDGKVSYRNA